MRYNDGRVVSFKLHTVYYSDQNREYVIGWEDEPFNLGASVYEELFLQMEEAKKAFTKPILEYSKTVKVVGLSIRPMWGVSQSDDGKCIGCSTGLLSRHWVNGEGPYCSRCGEWREQHEEKRTAPIQRMHTPY